MHPRRRLRTEIDVDGMLVGFVQAISVDQPNPSGSIPDPDVREGTLYGLAAEDSFVILRRNVNPRPLERRCSAPTRFTPS